MGHTARFIGGLALALGVVSACGQELALPQRAATTETGAGLGPSDGLTGASGAPEDSPSKRLPLLDEPTYQSGGAEGEGAPRQGCESCASAGRGGSGSKNRSDAASAVAGDGGDGGVGGRAGERPVTTPTAVLLFSEYVEGTSSNKALELYAVQAGTLEGCEIRTYFNGGDKPTRLELHGELAQGELSVLCSPKFASWATAACDTFGNLTFNGDDAIALSCAGIVQDVIGTIGADPGDGWGNGATLDHTLRRRCSVASGNTAASTFDVEAEWITDPEDTFGDLGKRGF
jgi:hypothetical protein